ncbi:O-antigen ligase family protein [Galbitalea sp. SE-J8]|uniref:O-antigen ligase family protein n=1 Tax=Galbitalea sp. SE-J8 TaxID=3054952 RepID=UPI00259CFE43|nr:O-antigen ligase family protein [Galbitalea sp. SE-J8]MDM4763918.1 O-antigen ligase family protein [Galbitalea sp. SE-J8]
MSTLNKTGGQSMPLTRLPPALAERLLYFAVILVPFQQALTLTVGFPLKMSEITAILGLILLLVERRAPAIKFVGVSLVGVLAILVLASTVWQLFLTPPAESAPGYSGGLNGDLVQYCAYGMLVLLVCWFVGTRLGPDWIGRGLGLAVRLAAIYCIIQLGLFLAGASSIVTLVNGENQIGTAYGLQLTRNGPFLEGNYLGFFSGVGLFTSIKRRDKWGIIASVFCLFYSESTTGLVGVVAALLLIVVTRPTGIITTAVAFAGLVAATAFTVIPSVNTYVLRQLGKLGFVDADGSASNVLYSRRSRTLNIETGFDMGFHHPFLGVGPGRYGFWYSTYADLSGLPSNINSGITRPIANSAYAQIISELGVIAFVAFAALLLMQLWRLRNSFRADLALAAFVAIGLNATPAWTVLPIWLTIAYLSTVPAADMRETEYSLRAERLARRGSSPLRV